MFLRNLIKGFMMMEGDGGGQGGSPAGADVDGFSGDPVQLDALAGETPAAGDPPPGTGGGAGAEPEPLSIELDGQTYSEEALINLIQSGQSITAREQALNKRGEDMNALLASVERARGEHMGGAPAPHAPSGTGPLEMTGEAMREMILDNPDNFKTVLAQYVHEAVTSTVQEQVGDMDARNTAQTHFTGKHGDFNETVRSPEFAEFYGKLPTDAQGQPIYNEVNAYLEFENVRLNGQLEAAKKAGYDAGAAATIANTAAKNRITVLRGGGGAGMPSPGGAPDVKTMPHGQFLNTAMDMILAKRAGGNNGG